MKSAVWALAILLVVVISLQATEAGKGRRGRGRGRNRQSQPAVSDEGCSEWEYSECVPKRGTCGRGRKNGTRTGDTCEVKALTFPCKLPCQDGAGRRNKKCKYQRDRDVPVTACDESGHKNITLKLKSGDTSECQESKVVTRPCGGGRRRGRGRAHLRNPRSAEKAESTLETGERRRENGCKYTKNDWSECAEDGMMTRIMTLKWGDPNSCEATKTKTRPCRKGASSAKKERKQQRKEERKLQRKTARKEAKDQRKQDKQEQKAHKQARKEQKQAIKQNGCTYTKHEWSDCDTTTNVETRTRTLTAGDATACQQTLQDERPCKEQCEYTAWSDWTACQDNKKTKTRRLTAGSERCGRDSRLVKEKSCTP